MKILIRFASILFSVITVSALTAHVLELPGKMALSQQDYMAVQTIYRGWAWLGIFEIGAIVFTFVWLLNRRKRRRRYYLTGIAVLLFLVSLGVFFQFTFPVNRMTENWTLFRPDWEKLRAQWEYSHAIRAALNFTGLCLLLFSLIPKNVAARERYP